MKKALLLFTLFSCTPFCLADTLIADPQLTNKQIEQLKQEFPDMGILTEKELNSLTVEFTVEAEETSDDWIQIAEQSKQVLKNAKDNKQDPFDATIKFIRNVKNDLKFKRFGMSFSRPINNSPLDLETLSPNTLGIKFVVQRLDETSNTTWEEAKKMNKELEDAFEDNDTYKNIIDLVAPYLTTLRAMSYDNPTDLATSVHIYCRSDHWKN